MKKRIIKDEPKYRDIYSNPMSVKRISISLDNWKKSKTAQSDFSNQVDSRTFEKLKSPNY